MMAGRQENIETVRAFFDQWGRDYGQLHASYGAFFTDECVWENSGFPTCTGPVEAVEVMLEPAHEELGLETIKVDIEKISADGDIVWSERVDHLLRADGTVIASVPLVGVMVFADNGRVRRWREYFDSKAMLDAIAEPAGGAS
jgi:limonene-1,2-epoxide hydrolase